MKQTIQTSGTNAGKTNQTFFEALAKYLAAITDANKDDGDPNRKFEIRIGKRFVKIVEWFYNQEMVFCFVEITTGDIHKFGTWNQPQPNGKRGNVYTGPMPLKTSEFYVRK